jgi:molybdopterin molybdotransferase
MGDCSSYPVLSVEEAQERILAHFSPLEPVTLPILEALGRGLVSDIVSVAPVPPHDNSAMDGYAVRHGDLGSPPSAALQVIGQVPAGSVWEGTLGARQALRIMTGAPMPAGADTVVRFEDTESTETTVHVLRAPQRGANVRYAGEDVRPGQMVLSAGTVLGPAEIGMLASLGLPQVSVHRRPRVAVLATGDEILPIDAPPHPGKIRNINSYSSAAQILQVGGEPLILEIAGDQESALLERLRRALDLKADLIVTSGGVSVGDFDLVKQVLSAQGALDFWWVNMKPGRPLAFGLLNDTPLLALPGNPVAAMLGMLLFGLPTIRRMLGLPPLALPTVQARLAESIVRKDGRRHYLRVTLANDQGGPLARLTGDQGSGILNSMVQADGLAIIPENVEHLDAGSVVQVITLR